MIRNKDVELVCSLLNKFNDIDGAEFRTEYATLQKVKGTWIRDSSKVICYCKDGEVRDTTLFYYDDDLDIYSMISKCASMPISISMTIKASEHLRRIEPQLVGSYVVRKVSEKEGAFPVFDGDKFMVVSPDESGKSVTSEWLPLKFTSEPLLDDFINNIK